MSTKNRYHQAILHGGRHDQGSWAELVAKAVAEDEEYRAAYDVALLQRLVNESLRKEYAIIYPGMMVVQASDILGAEAEIARLTDELDEIHKLIDQDLNSARRARMLSTIELVRSRIAARGEPS